MEITFENIQPSQFYLSKTKLADVLLWFNPLDLTNFSPLPIKKLGNNIILTDGHTRAYAAYSQGLDRVPFIWDEDELNWELYQKCVDECQNKNVFRIKDFQNRILSYEDYDVKWHQWCDFIHKQ